MLPFAAWTARPVREVAQVLEGYICIVVSLVSRSLDYAIMRLCDYELCDYAIMRLCAKFS